MCMLLATRMLASAGQPLRHCSTPVAELQASDTMSYGKSGSSASETALHDVDSEGAWAAQGKARLGTVVHMKNAAALALTAVKGEDQRELDKVLESARTGFNDAPRMSWGGGIMGPKSQAKARKRDRELQKDLAQRLG